MSDKIDYIQHLEIYCKEHNYDRPEYYNYGCQGNYTGCYAIFRGMKYEPPNNPSFPSLSKANNTVAKYILDTIEVAKELFGSRQIVKKEKITVLYLDTSHDTPFTNIFRYILEYGRDTEFIGFSRNDSTGKDSEKYINILNTHSISSNPEYDLLWYVAENYKKLKGKKIHVECENLDLKNFIKKRLEILE
jgi:hypothetical protein